MSQVVVSPARERVLRLLDEGSFIELGALVQARNTDFNLSSKDTPGDGVITGYGTIDHSLVYVYSQDASVLGGSMGEMHAKKIAGLYSMAMKVGAPVIGLIDCGGFRLEEGVDALEAFGLLYKNQALASGVIPQIQAVFGSCGGGMAASLGMSDFTFLERDKAKVFFNSPDAIKGNREGKLDTASAEYRAREVGNVDFLGSEGEIIQTLRDLIGMIPASHEDDLSYEDCTDDLNRLHEGLSEKGKDGAALLREIADHGRVLELKKEYGPEMITAFIRLNGNTVGCVVNSGFVYDAASGSYEEYPPLLSGRGVAKAAEFVRFCDAFSIPILTLTEVKGYKATKCTEKRMQRSIGALIGAFAEATVPKVNLIKGEAFGSAYVAMNSKSVGADMVLAWPGASIGMMDAGEAVKIIYARERKEAEDPAAFLAQKESEYAALQSSVLSAAHRGQVDAIIDPSETRKCLIAAFEMLFTKREDRPYKKHSAK